MREIPNGTCFSNQRMYAPLPEKKNEGRQRSRRKRVKNNSFFFFVGAFGVDIIKIGYWLPSIKGRYLASKKKYLELRYRQAGRGSNRCLYCICMDFFCVWK